MKYQPGERLGNYRILHSLGRGGFAEVYLGEQVYLKTRAALKVLHVQLTKEQVSTFSQEARTLAHLHHPYIVPVLDFAVQDDVPFLVLHYAPRGSVRNLHPKGSCLPLSTIVPYAKQIASALQFAHDQHLIHRDVKPENMLLGHHDVVLLSDFGLAMTVQSIQGPELHHVAGTLPYMAPEQVQGHPCYASDQYALGIVIYEWLCGKPPFTGLPAEIMVQQINTLPASLCEKLPDLLPVIEEVVFTALHKDPQRRFSSVNAFAAALEDAWQANHARSTTVVKQDSALSWIPPHVATPLHQHALVGREQEQGWLQRLLFEAEQQKSTSDMRPRRTCGAVLLGEAGIGKTRLAEDLSATAQSRGWVVLWSRSYAQEHANPYQSWIEMIHIAIRIGLWSPQDAKLPPHLSQALAPLLPELALQLLSAQAHSSPQEMSQSSFYIPEAICAIFTMMSRQTPVLVVLDDIHWADAKSQEVLGNLLRRLTGCPFLLLGTCREDDLVENHTLSTLFSNLQRERVLSTLTVSALSDVAVRALISHLPEPLISSIQQRVAGNPFFAEELALLFSAEEQEGTQKKLRTSSRPRSSFPDTIRAVLDERLRRLSTGCQQLLQSVSVLHHSFSLMVLQFIEQEWQRSRSGKDLLVLLEEALKAGVLIEEGVGADIQYRFWHPLFVDYLYESLSATRRSRLHLRSAQVLQQIYALREDEGAALIVSHLLAGGADSRSIALYAERAAHYCYRLCAYADAEQYYRVALQRTLPTDAENLDTRISKVSDTYLHHAFLLEYLGDCCRVQGKYEQATEYFEQALKIHQQYDVPISERDVQIQALLWCEIANSYYDRRMLTHSLGCCERGEQMLKSAEITTGPALAFLRLQQGFVCWQEGQHAEAEVLAQEALVLFNDALPYIEDQKLFMPLARLRRTLRGDPTNVGRAQMLLGYIAGATGRYAIAITQLKAALFCFKQQRSQRELTIVYTGLGDVYLKTAEHEKAQALFEQALPIAEWMGDVPLESVIYINLSIVVSRMGKLVEAENWCRKALLLAEHIHDRFYVCMFYVYLTMFLYAQGKRDEGKESLQHAYLLQEELQIPLFRGLTMVIDAEARLNVVMADEVYSNDDGLYTRNLSDKSTSQLQDVQGLLQQVEALEGLDTEILIEARILFAQISLLLGDRESALHQAKATLEEANQTGLAWASIRIYRLLGSILMEGDQQKLAQQHFEWAIQQCQKSKMRLEYARTLMEWGDALLKRRGLEQNVYVHAKQYLQEAQLILRECHAVLDLQRLEHILI